VPKRFKFGPFRIKIDVIYRAFCRGTAGLAQPPMPV
jgi:hypothetical protein